MWEISIQILKIEEKNKKFGTKLKNLKTKLCGKF